MFTLENKDAGQGAKEINNIIEGKRIETEFVLQNQ
jgi:hypothetical protein